MINLVENHLYNSQNAETENYDKNIFYISGQWKMKKSQWGNILMKLWKKKRTLWGSSLELMEMLHSGAQSKYLFIMGWNQFSRSIYLFSCLLHFHEIFRQFWKWFLMIILYYLIIVSEKDFMKMNAVVWNWEWSLIIFSNALLCWSFTNLWTSNLEQGRHGWQGPQGLGLA